ncbi:MAG: DUF4041 domain-containing protein [Deltaproteobacteria bacterium]|nr:DUF4041 domain-containing protein [Deltaproteobacteria bacterium]
MSYPVLILLLAALAVSVGVCLYFAMSKKRALQEALQAARKELERYAPIRNVDSEVSERRRKLEEEVTQATQQINAARRELEAEMRRKREYELKLDMEEMGFYQPKFEFEDSLKYAEALDLIREAQKELIRQKLVLDGVTSNTPTSVRKLGLLAVDALNGDASTIINGVTYSNFEASKEKFRVEFDKINRLLEETGIRISPKYLELKVKEMAIAYDYREAEEKARQEQAELKEMMREEEDARVEAEKAREKAIEEEQLYQQALETARQELEVQLQQAKVERERATSMAQITKKGHVYIISNLGSFGEGVFKIGVTRRKEPDERIRELGDASVPFGFDVHALVHADDAPALEAVLHNHFQARRMNKVNLRKEFFRVSMDEIAEACEKLGCPIRLSKLAEAREYRATLALEANASG